MVSCEKDVVDKLVKVLRYALECSSGIVATEELDESFILRVMKTVGKATGNYAVSNETGVDSSEFAEYGEKNDTSVPNLDVTNLQDAIDTEREINKFHKFEIIKVVVLITVISIIMLTTCRMIFQLFVRFHPEKAN